MPACCNADSVSTLLALVDDAVVIADLEGRIAGWSQGAELLAGYAARDILGLDGNCLYTEEGRAAHREHWGQLLGGGATRSFDATLLKNNGAAQPVRVELALMHDANGEPASVLSHIRASGDAGRLPSFAATQESQLRRDRMLRATLMRETNHRIKNSLQGVIGMMRLQGARRSSVREVIDQSVAQLMAVAVSFGLAGRHGESQIVLGDLVTDIAKNLEQVSRHRVQVQISAAAVLEPVMLTERYGANMSLVINELVFNAIKHGAGAGDQHELRVTVDRNNDSAVLRVINESGALPPGFSLEQDTGLGTGLSLIKALLPRDCSSLSIGQTPEGVCAQLVLRYPMLASGSH
jgi:PAS domain S-box-containing protein